ncbi:multidrug ABC transporter permease [Companilactobacillus bobalius]|uniref:multidrug ABC transporter permease n=1 Tax=Companilactobacillus bobalius TaxID=2801451 RepID=UPI0013023612|nr:multidrug ABC transporter permease [Companilactobacillus bobalius]KAE9560603.1 hypothetical protein ATN92_10715 [Companilactobacillus bobalius]
MRFLRLFCFHLKIYASNQYFLWLTISSTISLFLLQFIVAYATKQLNDTSLWIRSGIFGLWSSATTSAGCIGFQRFQGLLEAFQEIIQYHHPSFLYLPFKASSFGLLSFPVSYLLAVLLGVSHSNVSMRLVLLVGTLWLAASLMDFLIAGLFLLTTNAIVYEELITIPLLLLSGLFSSAPILKPILIPFQWIIPIASPIHALLNSTSEFNFLGFILSCVLWGVVTWILTKYLLILSKRTGNVRLM